MAAIMLKIIRGFSMLSPGSHPVDLLDFFTAAFGQFELEFSKYIYRPRSTLDDREYFRASAAEAFRRYKALEEGLLPSQDLALHSTITFSGSNKRHIPMMDLMGKFDESWVQPIGRAMALFGVEEFAVYSTGRSAHVYGLGLISPEQVTPFFARSLLLNLPDQPPIVDSRWIGHRLLAGYGSLRWSCNGEQYLQKPEWIGTFRG
jgi:hypothetical protein